MSIPTPFNPLGALGAVEPVPELSDTITVPRGCGMVVPLYGLQEFIVEFSTDFAASSTYNITAGALGIIGYGKNGAAGWFSYRSYSNQGPELGRWIRPQSYSITALESALDIEYNGYKESYTVSGALRSPDIKLASTSSSTPEREVDIPLVGGSFVVKAVDGTLVHDYRFRADGLGFYDMVERKNYYFNA